MAGDERFEVLVPLPRSITPTDGTLVLTANGAPRPITVQTNDGVGRPAWLIDYLTRFPGLELAAAGRLEGGIAIRLEVGDRCDDDGGIHDPEAYRLVITTEAITVTGTDPAGLFWGLQTLRQLLPATNGSDSGDIEVPTGTIADAPRFAWRGLMLDVARHFFGVGEITRIIDAMALYKMNRLHLHLSDDQGWRLAIDGYPELTEVAARRRWVMGPAATSPRISTASSSPTPRPAT